MARRVRAQAGLSLVELMVAVTIGLLIVAALTALFVKSSSARREIERSAEMQESGRYALQFLRNEIAHAGFYGPLVGPTGSTDLPCSTTVSEWSDSLLLHVSASNDDDITTRFACIAGTGATARKAGTDAIFVQRAATCSVGESGCDPQVAGTAYLQVSGCGNEYSTQPFVAAVAPSATASAPFALHKKDCTTQAPLRRFVRRIFFVANDNSLRYVDLGPDGPTAPVLVSAGVENLQFSYAIDSDADGSPNSYSAAPDAASLPNTVGVRVWLLARSTEEGLAPEGKSYQLDTLNLSPTDRLKRHVYASYISFITPAGAKE
ncbi:MAG: type pilus assembly protein PilW [Pseudomonadota bacterium]|jgi:type IV pilus assembly protein PilW